MTPHVDDYTFGHIVVDGKTFSKDLKLFPDHIETEWWREEGHLLQPEDLSDVFDYNPGVLVVGQGNSGRMKIADTTKQRLDEEDITLKVGRTQNAIQVYNDVEEDVVGAFHLTC